MHMEAPFKPLILMLNPVKYYLRICQWQLTFWKFELNLESVKENNKNVALIF